MTDAPRPLFLHIGMGKCGSTAIQSHLASLRTKDVHYITYPGEIDANPLISEYAREDIIPQSVRHATIQNPISTGFTDHIIKETTSSHAAITVISAEHLSWLTDEESLENLYSRLLQPLAHNFRISIICYFRQPATSRFMSTLLEDARYNKTIKLYVPDWHYSENVVVYKRWQKLFGQRNLSWLPLLYDRKALSGGDVVEDFARRTGISRPTGNTDAANWRINESINPLFLSAIRKVIRQRQESLEWDRLSELVNKLAGLAAACTAAHQMTIPETWSFKGSLGDYIDTVSAPERRLVFVNSLHSDRQIATESSEHKNWSGKEIFNHLPQDITYTDGYLSGELESFLDGMDPGAVNSLAELMDLELLKVYSYS